MVSIIVLVYAFLKGVGLLVKFVLEIHHDVGNTSILVYAHAHVHTHTHTHTHTHENNRKRMHHPTLMIKTSVSRMKL